ncbi:transcriptional regulator [Nocardiopsis kunsanensis]|uniref:Transcriptional regulator n=1 Tax=Nocardiopsis kunsanensis TaxID=141693 RepID=A0A919CJZ3_9ACTN|nr:GAF domain-containing protein [Nocardiopsis kunsanensis]GHD31098.1 transcriptional regulator [Nocardiopsis kunsanensis]
MSGSANAWPWTADPDTVRREVEEAHEHFTDSGRVDVRVRPIVGESWLRSARHGVDPATTGPRVELDTHELHERRRTHPLAAVMPLVRHLLVETAPEPQIVAVGEADGRLLWVEGDHRLRTRAEDMRFVEGASWNEGSAGTNAPGLALAVDHEVQIFAVEHFARGVHEWSCSAAPLHDPATGQVLGFLDLTGTDHAASPSAMALVRAAASAADAEMRALYAAGRLPGTCADGADPAPSGTAPKRAGPPETARVPENGATCVRARPSSAGSPVWEPQPHGPGRGAAELRVLGRDRAAFTSGGATIELSLRHSELLLLLARHPAGLTGGVLGALLTDRGTSSVTVRAEVARLRRLLGEDVVASRPYRFRVPVRTDADRVRALLAEGALAEALDAYPGHLLPGSTAPGVGEARGELQAELCAVLEAADDPGTLLAWAEHPAWNEDPRAVSAAAAALPPDSPRRRILAGRLAWLAH